MSNVFSCPKCCSYGPIEENRVEGGHTCSQCGYTAHLDNFDMKKRYMEANGGVCPDCGIDQIEGGSISIEDGKAFQNSQCLNCNTSWTDVYTLSDVIIPTDDQPHLTKTSVKTKIFYNPNYGDNRLCECGHPYHRHFDSYEDNDACGCKYKHTCKCKGFKESI